ncbi:MAG TPA: cytochrome C oxidase subunit IV family protein [Phycisphaerales bacterium]|nr:cytochrome C oxidase subunit IV family protein [Phycisphaerales bacterium]
MAHHPPQQHFDETDPHGGTPHTHVIVPPITYRTVLAFLLFFTLLTVGVAQAEVWAMGYFDIHLPWWVNVVGAMSIAVVKSLLVMAFFMQLKYDNPINTVAMAFCFFGVFLFLFFTGLDLFTRERVYPEKNQYVVPGGTSAGVASANNKPVVVAAKDRWLEAWGPEQFEKFKAGLTHGHGHGHDAGDHGLSDAERARPRAGLSDALLTDVPHDDHGHGDGNVKHAAPAQTAPASGAAGHPAPAH